VIDLSKVGARLVGDRTKGMPGGLAPIALLEIGRQGWNLLHADLPSPRPVIRAIW
jgi:hypothetical protein